jgi:hypothetical protein
MRRLSRAQALAFFALALPLVLLPVAAYAVEAAHLASESARLQEVTQQAAEDGAQQVDTAALREGQGLRIDSARAEPAARTALERGAPGSRLEAISVTDRDLTLVAVEPVPLQLGSLLGRSSTVTVRARATARLTEGYDRPSSREPLPIRIF